jgi:hypothetical protein
MRLPLPSPQKPAPGLVSGIGERFVAAFISTNKLSIGSLAEWAAVTKSRLNSIALPLMSETTPGSFRFETGRPRSLSWNAELLREIRPALLENRIALLEQPLPAGSDHGLDGTDGALCGPRWFAMAGF